MFRAFSSIARRDITVKIVVPTSGNLLLNRKSTLQVLQSAGQRVRADSPLAQLLCSGQAALARRAHQQDVARGLEQSGVRQEIRHRYVPGAGGPRGNFLRGATIDYLEAPLDARTQ